MYFDRLDIVEAYYLFFVNFHEGQWSERYRRMCKMLRYFKPGPLFSKRSLSWNAKAIYNNLVQRERSEQCPAR